MASFLVGPSFGNLVVVKAVGIGFGFGIVGCIFVVGVAEIAVAVAGTAVGFVEIVSVVVVEIVWVVGTAVVAVVETVVGVVVDTVVGLALGVSVVGTAVVVVVETVAVVGSMLAAFGSVVVLVGRIVVPGSVEVTSDLVLVGIEIVASYLIRPLVFVDGSCILEVFLYSFVLIASCLPLVVRNLGPVIDSSCLL